MLKVFKGDTVANLEKALNARRQDLSQISEAFRAARLRADDLEDQLATALLDRAANAESLEQQHEAARRKVYALAPAVEKGHQAVRAAEQALEAERTKDLRAASAKRPRDAAVELERAIAGLQKPMAAVLAALDSASFQEVTHEIAPALFAQHMTRASQALAGGDGERFVEVLRNLADRIVAGEADFRLRPTLAEEAVALRKSA